MWIARICPLLIVAAAYAQEYTVPAGVTVLSEKEILAKVIGNTHNGKMDDGVPWSEYYEPPKGGEKKGKVRGKGRNHYSGTWKIDRSLLCLDYPGGDDNGCWTIAIKGETVVWYRPDVQSDP